MELVAAGLAGLAAIQHEGPLQKPLPPYEYSSHRQNISTPDTLALGVKSPPDLREIATLLLRATTAIQYMLPGYTYAPKDNEAFLSLEAGFAELTRIYDFVTGILWLGESEVFGKDVQHELEKQESEAAKLVKQISHITKPSKWSRWPRSKNRMVQAMGSKLDVMRGSLGFIAKLDRQVKTVTRTRTEVKVVNTTSLLRNSTLKRSNSFESTADQLDTCTDSRNVNLATMDLSSSLVRWSRPQAIEGPQFKQSQNSSSGQAYEAHIARHLEYRRTRTPGTCNWLLETEEYKKWRSSPTASNLWIHGAAGIGKSTLM
jgi:hypothetical protein